MAKRNRNLKGRTALAALTALALLLGLFTPERSYAAGFVPDSEGSYVSGEDEGGFYYGATRSQYQAGTCGLLLYSGKTSDITLPAAYGGCQVVTVDKSFSSMIPYLGYIDSLTTVKIPSGYRSIESGDNGQSGAFQNQTGLYRIEIPESVTQIGENVFDGCDYNKLTIVTPKGSAAEKYAKSHGIHYTTSKALKVVFGKKKISVGKKRRILVYNNGADIVWKSSNPSVASVSRTGVVKAKKAGKVTITAVIAKKKYSFRYRVV